jgi:hypothetical protein
VRLTLDGVMQALGRPHEDWHGLRPRPSLIGVGADLGQSVCNAGETRLIVELQAIRSSSSKDSTREGTKKGDRRHESGSGSTPCHSVTSLTCTEPGLKPFRRGPALHSPPLGYLPGEPTEITHKTNPSPLQEER